MDRHELAEKTAGLASRVNNLAVATTGQDSRSLLQQQDDLTKLAMAAIVQDLQAEQDGYLQAVNALNEAIQAVDTATQKIDDVAKAVELVAKAISAVGKVLQG